MKKTIALTALFFTVIFFFAHASLNATSANKGSQPNEGRIENTIEASFPPDMNCIPQPMYGYRKDGESGREVLIHFNGAKLTGRAQLEVKVHGGKEITQLTPSHAGDTTCSVLLPPGIGLNQESHVTLTLRQGGNTLTKAIYLKVNNKCTLQHFYKDWLKSHISNSLFLSILPCKNSMLIMLIIL